MTEAEIYSELSEIFQDIFLRDDLVLRPELSARDVADWDSFKQIDIINPVAPVEIRAQGVSVLLTEREPALAKAVADRVEMMERGAVIS